jgi:retron-type reverse transcriptase
VASDAFRQITAWSNLLLAFRKAARGKRYKAAVARFENRMADELLGLRQALGSGAYRPGAYTHFTIHEPKRRLISAAPFRDRVVHHALCNIIEPRFESSFIGDSYANRVGKGTHGAVDRLQGLARRYRYVLRADVVRHFPSIDHQILLGILARHIPEDDVMALVETIIASGAGVLDDEYPMVWFPGDDLLAACRPRGLPIGNLTSQFWSNCYLHPFDDFCKRRLRCPAYLRYVDDLALFGDSKSQLWDWKHAIVERLARLRLTIHDSRCQVVPTAGGIPWLGFIVYPGHRRLKARKVAAAGRRLGERYDAYLRGAISFAELDASVKGWVNHVRYADTWGLRRQLLDRVASRAYEKIRPKK